MNLEDVSQHRSVDDCWIVIDNVVLDITNWLSQHPGGDQVLLANAGSDASALFHSVFAHDASAYKFMMETYQIGRLKELDPESHLPVHDDQAESGFSAPLLLAIVVVFSAIGMMVLLKRKKSAAFNKTK